MTVSFVDVYGVHTVWFDGKQAREGRFSEEVLAK